MAYRKVYFRIHTEGYVSGWSSDSDKAAFKEESRRLFKSLGWTLTLGHNGCCDTVTKGQGEIILTDIEPGTYLAIERDTGDAGHILDASYQEVVKTIRGLGGIAVTSTQGMQDLFGLDGGKYGKGILDSSRIKLVMQMEEQEARLIQGVLNLSEDEVRQITRFRRGEGLLCIGYNHVPVQFHTTEKEYNAHFRSAGTAHPEVRKRHLWKCGNDTSRSAETAPKSKRKKLYGSDSYGNQSVRLSGSGTDGRGAAGRNYRSGHERTGTACPDSGKLRAVDLRPGDGEGVRQRH